MSDQPCEVASIVVPFGAIERLALVLVESGSREGCQIVCVIVCVEIEHLFSPV